jgi:hypothetical protein
MIRALDVMGGNVSFWHKAEDFGGATNPAGVLLPYSAKQSTRHFIHP